MGDSKFLIDSGCQINLIKEKNVASKMRINPKSKYHLVGIGEGSTETLGEIDILIDGLTVKFQTIPNDFPIKQDGILGVDILHNHSASLNFKPNGDGSLTLNGKYYSFLKNASIKLPARAKTLVCIPVKNAHSKEGYLPRLNLGPDIYGGEAIVTPFNGCVQCYITNSSTDDINNYLFSTDS